MKPVDKTLWDNFKGAIQGPFSFISVGDGPKDTKRFVVAGQNNKTYNLSLRPAKVHVVGVDIVGYSRRSSEAQLILTGLLFARVEATVNLLRQVGWIQAAQPQVSIPLGDGAMLVFDGQETLASSLAFVYCLNMWIEDLNRQYLYRPTSTEFEASQPYPVLPIHCRYVLNTGEVFYIKDINGVDNAVGEALVRCARIAASSKGAHFLVDAEVMGEIGANGGIDGVRHRGDPWDWQQSLYTALMPETKVKSAVLRFYNVFGKYRNARLLEVQHADPNSGPVYNIGSHDVSTIIV